MLMTRSAYQTDCDPAVMAFKRRGLRDALICIGWLKLLSVVYYISLYFLVYLYSQGQVPFVLKIMLLVAIPFQILHGTLLFYGSLESKILPLDISLWLCLIIASYNTVLGTIGCIYFIRTGSVAMHFILAVAFMFLAFSLFTVLCHDVLMVYAYKQIILSMRDQQVLESAQSTNPNQRNVLSED